MAEKTLILAALILLAAVLCPAQDLEDELLNRPGNRGSIGVGYGIPYGGLGVNADVYFIDNAALTAGVGSFGYTAGYAIGAKYLYGKPSDLWRPQAVISYGINKVLYIDREPEADLREAYQGFSLGLGSQFMFGKSRKHGFDIDALYIVSSGIFKRVGELESQGYNIGDISRFTFSLGYRFAFDLKF